MGLCVYTYAMRLDSGLIDGLEQLDYVTSFKMSPSSADGHRIECECKGLQKCSIVVFLEGHNRSCIQKTQEDS